MALTDSDFLQFTHSDSETYIYLDPNIKITDQTEINRLREFGFQLNGQNTWIQAMKDFEPRRAEFFNHPIDANKSLTDKLARLGLRYEVKPVEGKNYGVLYGSTKTPHLAEHFKNIGFGIGSKGIFVHASPEMLSEEQLNSVVDRISNNEANADLPPLPWVNFDQQNANSFTVTVRRGLPPHIESKLKDTILNKVQSTPPFHNKNRPNVYSFSNASRSAAINLLGEYGSDKPLQLSDANDPQVAAIVGPAGAQENLVQYLSSENPAVRPSRSGNQLLIGKQNIQSFLQLPAAALLVKEAEVLQSLTSARTARRQQDQRNNSDADLQSALGIDSAPEKRSTDRTSDKMNQTNAGKLAKPKSKSKPNTGSTLEAYKKQYDEWFHQTYSSPDSIISDFLQEIETALSETDIDINDFVSKVEWRNEGDYQKAGNKPIKTNSGKNKLSVNAQYITHKGTPYIAIVVHNVGSQVTKHYNSINDQREKFNSDRKNGINKEDPQVKAQKAEARRQALQALDERKKKAAAESAKVEARKDEDRKFLMDRYNATPFNPSLSGAPYVTAKELDHLPALPGVKVLRDSYTDPNTGKRKEGDLCVVVPMMNNRNEVKSLHKHFDKSDSRSSNKIASGSNKGLYYLVGNPKNVPDRPIMMTEGFADQQVMLEAGRLKFSDTDGLAVACGINGGNLYDAALQLKKRFPEHDIGIGADNDSSDKVKGNRGLIFAFRAAHAVDGFVTYPTTDELPGHVPEDIKDYCDIWGHKGFNSKNDALKYIVKTTENEIRPPKDPIELELFLLRLEGTDSKWINQALDKILNVAAELEDIDYDLLNSRVGSIIKQEFGEDIFKEHKEHPALDVSFLKKNQPPQPEISENLADSTPNEAITTKTFDDYIATPREMAGKVSIKKANAPEFALELAGYVTDPRADNNFETKVYPYVSVPEGSNPETTRKNLDLIKSVIPNYKPQPRDLWNWKHPTGERRVSYLYAYENSLHKVKTGLHSLLNTAPLYLISQKADNGSSFLELGGDFDVDQGLIDNLVNEYQGELQSDSTYRFRDVTCFDSISNALGDLLIDPPDARVYFSIDPDEQSIIYDKEGLVGQLSTEQLSAFTKPFRNADFMSVAAQRELPRYLAAYFQDADSKEAYAKKLLQLRNIVMDCNTIDDFYWKYPNLASPATDAYEYNVLQKLKDLGFKSEDKTYPLTLGDFKVAKRITHQLKWPVYEVSYKRKPIDRIELNLGFGADEFTSSVFNSIKSHLESEQITDTSILQLFFEKQNNVPLLPSMSANMGSVKPLTAFVDSSANPGRVINQPGENDPVIVAREDGNEVHSSPQTFEQNTGVSIESKPAEQSSNIPEDLQSSLRLLQINAPERIYQKSPSGYVYWLAGSDAEQLKKSRPDLMAGAQYEHNRIIRVPNPINVNTLSKLSIKPVSEAAIKDSLVPLEQYVEKVDPPYLTFEATSSNKLFLIKSESGINTGLYTSSSGLKHDLPHARYSDALANYYSSVQSINTKAKSDLLIAEFTSDFIASRLPLPTKIAANVSSALKQTGKYASGDISIDIQETANEQYPYQFVISKSNQDRPIASDIGASYDEAILKAVSQIVVNQSEPNLPINEIANAAFNQSLETPANDENKIEKDSFIPDVIPEVASNNNAINTDNSSEVNIEKIDDNSLLSDLAKSKDLDVLRKVARNANTDQMSLLRLSRNKELILDVLSNPNCPESTLIQHALSQKAENVTAVLANPHIPSKSLNSLIHHEDSSIRNTARSIVDSSLDRLVDLSELGSEYALLKLASRGFNEETAFTLFANSSTQLWANDIHPILRSGQLDNEFLARLINDKTNDTSELILSISDHPQINLENVDLLIALNNDSIVEKLLLRVDLSAVQLNSMLASSVNPELIEAHPNFRLISKAETEVESTLTDAELESALGIDAKLETISQTDDLTTDLKNDDSISLPTEQEPDTEAYRLKNELIELIRESANDYDTSEEVFSDLFTRKGYRLEDNPLLKNGKINLKHVEEVFLETENKLDRNEFTNGLEYVKARFEVLYEEATNKQIQKSLPAEVAAIQNQLSGKTTKSIGDILFLTPNQLETLIKYKSEIIKQQDIASSELLSTLSILDEKYSSSRENISKRENEELLRNIRSGSYASLFHAHLQRIIQTDVIDLPHEDNIIQSLPTEAFRNHPILVDTNIDDNSLGMTVKDGIASYGIYLANGQLLELNFNHVLDPSTINAEFLNESRELNNHFDYQLVEWPTINRLNDHIDRNQDIPEIYNQLSTSNSAFGRALASSSNEFLNSGLSLGYNNGLYSLSDSNGDQIPFSITSTALETIDSVIQRFRFDDLGKELTALNENRSIIKGKLSHIGYVLSLDTGENTIISVSSNEIHTTSTDSDSIGITNQDIGKTVSIKTKDGKTIEGELKNKSEQLFISDENGTEQSVLGKDAFFSDFIKSLDPHSYLGNKNAELLLYPRLVQHDDIASSLKTIARAETLQAIKQDLGPQFEDFRLLVDSMDPDFTVQINKNEPSYSLLLKSEVIHSGNFSDINEFYRKNSESLSYNHHLVSESGTEVLWVDPSTLEINSATLNEHLLDSDVNASINFNGQTLSVGTSEISIPDTELAIQSNKNSVLQTIHSFKNEFIGTPKELEESIQINIRDQIDESGINECIAELLALKQLRTEHVLINQLNKNLKDEGDSVQVGYVGLEWAVLRDDNILSRTTYPTYSEAYENLKKDKDSPRSYQDLAEHIEVESELLNNGFTRGTKPDGTPSRSTFTYPLIEGSSIKATISGELRLMGQSQPIEARFEHVKRLREGKTHDTFSTLEISPDKAEELILKKGAKGSENSIKIAALSPKLLELEANDSGDFDSPSFTLPEHYFEKSTGHIGFIQDIELSKDYDESGQARLMWRSRHESLEAQPRMLSDFQSNNADIAINNLLTKLGTSPSDLLARLLSNHELSSVSEGSYKGFYAVSNSMDELILDHVDRNSNNLLSNGLKPKAGYFETAFEAVQNAIRINSGGLSKDLYKPHDRILEIAFSLRDNTPIFPSQDDEILGIVNNHLPVKSAMDAYTIAFDLSFTNQDLAVIKQRIESLPIVFQGSSPFVSLDDLRSLINRDWDADIEFPSRIESGLHFIAKRGDEIAFLKDNEIKSVTSMDDMSKNRNSAGDTDKYLRISDDQSRVDYVSIDEAFNVTRSGNKVINDLVKAIYQAVEFNFSDPYLTLSKVDTLNGISSLYAKQEVLSLLDKASELNSSLPEDVVITPVPNITKKLADSHKWNLIVNSDKFGNELPSDLNGLDFDNPAEAYEGFLAASEDWSDIEVNKAAELVDPLDAGRDVNFSYSATPPTLSNDFIKLEEDKFIQNGSPLIVSGVARQARLKGIIELRDSYIAMIEASQNGAPGYMLRQMQEELKNMYSEFHKKFGQPSEKTNIKLLKSYDDSSFGLFSSICEYQKSGYKLNEVFDNPLAPLNWQNQYESAVTNIATLQPQLEANLKEAVRILSDRKQESDGPAIINFAVKGLKQSDKPIEATCDGYIELADKLQQQLDSIKDTGEIGEIYGAKVTVNKTESTVSIGFDEKIILPLEAALNTLSNIDNVHGALMEKIHSLTNELEGLTSERNDLANKLGITLDSPKQSNELSSLQKTVEELNASNIDLDAATPQSLEEVRSMSR